ncbi:MAG: hypothetical protein ACYSUK_04970 [Planctomycetota bacterium]|jgi:ribosomal protein S27AE
MKGKKLITSMRGGVLAMSKPVMIIVLVACLVLAVVLYILLLPDQGGGYEELAGQLALVKCSNSDCNAEYEIDEAEFMGAINEIKKQNPMYPGDPPVACKQCGQQSVMAATKCGKCGIVFFKGELGPGHFRDECPECGYSATKERRQGKTGAAQ